MVTVLVSSRTVPPLAMSAYLISLARFFFDCTLTIDAVSVVLPWSMCPMVPTFTCGLLRSNFFFAISCPLLALHDLGRDVRRKRLVVIELHRVHAPTLGRRPQIGRVAEHRRERDERVD